MANPEHVAIVKQGAKAMREWGEKHPDVRSDLVKANFRGADLSGADLSGASLAFRRTVGVNPRVQDGHGGDTCTLEPVGVSTCLACHQIV
jgi:hypothetical protein